MSSFAKDLVCTPRPYSPPVVRLGESPDPTDEILAESTAMSTHAHEYGFPSSHSTNTLTIALFLGQWVWETREAVGSVGYVIANAGKIEISYPMIEADLYESLSRMC